ncbi:restriction endonuclease subunit S [Gilliamella apicola]|uniref:restriction endonuclease subunit S n=1 Tax=Gilliamella apicola TaxID=1196095 RepID=UPI000D783125|nr:restriction endonuclease subunit S [Gilliamella apicola]PXY98155.1 restriction endonuclease subunit S [Gilliamella apicola]WLS91919.1 restriction endonuclease subunit S [Gilliamella apicola]
MSKTKKLVPKRRFKGYNNEWKLLSRIGDYSEILTGGTPSTQEKSFWQPKEILWMSSGEVHRKRILYTDNMISKKGFENSSARWVKENSILIALAGQGKTRGTVAINHIPITTNQSIASITPSKILNSEFLFQNFDMRYEELRTISSGDGTRGGLNKKIIFNMNIITPSLKEQTQIGEFFKKLDDLIQTQQKKLEKTKTLKSAYLVELFPKDDESNPKIRFKGMKENWMPFKLKDVIERELKGKTKATMLGNENIYLDANYLNGGEINYVNASKDVTLNDVLILWDGSLAGTVYHGFEGALGSTLKAYKPKESGQFLYQFLKKNQQNIFDNYRTPNIPHVIKTFTEEFRITIPHIKEQTKIGNFFKLLDKKIALEQRKLEKLNNIKQAYLNEMFV